MAIQTADQPNRAWIHKGAAVAAATLLLLLMVWFTWWEFHTPGKGDEIDVGDVPRMGRMRQPVQQIGKDQWMVWSQAASLYISGSPAKDFNVDLRARNLISDDQRDLARTGQRVAHDRHVAQAIGATKDQVTKLRTIQLERSVVSPSDLANLKKQWSDYQSADASKKPNAIKSLQGTLMSVAQSSIGPTKNEWANAASLTKQTLSADQITKFKQYERDEQKPKNQSATSQPTTRKTN